LNEKVKKIDEENSLIPAFVDNVVVVVIDPVWNGFLSIIILMIDWKVRPFRLTPCMLQAISKYTFSLMSSNYQSFSVVGINCTFLCYCFVFGKFGYFSVWNEYFPWKFPIFFVFCGAENITPNPTYEEHWTISSQSHGQPKKRSWIYKKGACTHMVKRCRTNVVEMT